MNNFETDKNIWDFIHIFGKTFNPSLQNGGESFSCMFDCLSILIPDDTFKIVISAFIKQNPPLRYTGCSDKTFEWTYKLRNYYNMVLKRRGQPSENISFNKLQEEYTFITKSDWGRPTWFMMHYISANLPEMLTPEISTAFKAFVVCLSFILPCEECKEHMNKYIQNSEIDPYLKTRKDIFGWTWYFHNEVNKRINKPVVDFDTAYKMYSQSGKYSQYTLIDY